MTNLTIKNFCDADELYDYFVQYGRGDNFTRKQMEVIYDLFNDCAPDVEIDVIGICCEFTGYDSIEEALEEYDCESVHELENKVCVLYARDGEVVVQD